MLKSFNLEGPCKVAKHYMIPASKRLGDEILGLVEQEKYFLLRAPRQTGKTTLLLDLARRINGQGKYYAMCCSLLSMKRISDPREGIPLLIGKVKQFVSVYGLPNSEVFDRDFGRILQCTLRILQIP